MNVTANRLLVPVYVSDHHTIFIVPAPVSDAVELTDDIGPVPLHDRQFVSVS